MKRKLLNRFRKNLRLACNKIKKIQKTEEVLGEFRFDIEFKNYNYFIEIEEYLGLYTIRLCHYFTDEEDYLVTSIVLNSEESDTDLLNRGKHFGSQLKKFGDFLKKINRKDNND